MKRTKTPSKLPPEELMEVMLSSLDQDNFEDTMPRALLEEFIREQGGDPEAIWKKLGPWIEKLMAERAKRMAGG